MAGIIKGEKLDKTKPSGWRGRSHRPPEETPQNLERSAEKKTIICRILRRRKRRQKQKLRKQTTQRAERKKETEMKLFRDLWKEHLLFSSYESWDSVRRRRCRSEAEREEDLLLWFPWEIQSEEFKTQRLGRLHVFRLVSTRAAARTRRSTLRWQENEQGGNTDGKHEADGHLIPSSWSQLNSIIKSSRLNAVCCVFLFQTSGKPAADILNTRLCFSPLKGPAARSHLTPDPLRVSWFLLNGLLKLKSYPSCHVWDTRPHVCFFLHFDTAVVF